MKTYLVAYAFTTPTAHGFGRVLYEDNPAFQAMDVETKLEHLENTIVTRSGIEMYGAAVISIAEMPT